MGLTLGIFFKIKGKADPLNYKRGGISYLIRLLLIIIMAGFPPRPLFFIKLSLLAYLFLAKLRVFAVVLILIARISIFNYLNVISIRVIIRTRYHIMRL